MPVKHRLIEACRMVGKRSKGIEQVSLGVDRRGAGMYGYACIAHDPFSIGSFFRVPF